MLFSHRGSYENRLKNEKCGKRHDSRESSDQPVILIVDDDNEFIEDLLSFWNPPLPVHIARSGEEANEYLENNKPPALILLDIHLPRFFGEMDSEEGLAILHHIRTRISPSLPVIIISCFDSPEIMQRAEELGAQRYFKKPFDVTVLEEMVLHLLDTNETN